LLKRLNDKNLTQEEQIFKTQSTFGQYFARTEFWKFARFFARINKLTFNKL